MAAILEKLRIEQTKSRPRHSNDNAPAESENASVARKHAGCEHIPQKYAKPISAPYLETFDPWLNSHRPCMFATEIISPKGKIVRRHKDEDAKTPLECLVQLSVKGLVALKEGIAPDALQAQAKPKTDSAAAREMQRARSELFASFVKPKRRAWPIKKQHRKSTRSLG